MTNETNGNEPTQAPIDTCNEPIEEVIMVAKHTPQSMAPIRVTSKQLPDERQQVELANVLHELERGDGSQVEKIKQNVDPSKMQTEAPISVKSALEPGESHARNELDNSDINSKIDTNRNTTEFPSGVSNLSAIEKNKVDRSTSQSVASISVKSKQLPNERQEVELANVLYEMKRQGGSHMRKSKQQMGTSIMQSKIHTMMGTHLEPGERHARNGLDISDINSKIDTNRNTSKMPGGVHNHSTTEKNKVDRSTSQSVAPIRVKSMQLYNERQEVELDTGLNEMNRRGGSHTRKSNLQMGPSIMQSKIHTTMGTHLEPGEIHDKNRTGNSDVNSKIDTNRNTTQAPSDMTKLLNIKNGKPDPSTFQPKIKIKLFHVLVERRESVNKKRPTDPLAN
jgi:hypothetical protein